MKRRLITLASAAAFATLAAGGANAQDTIKIGLMATLEGTYTVLGEDGVRGFELAISQQSGNPDFAVGDSFELAGKTIETIVASTDASPDSAVRAARKLVEQDQVNIIVGPLSGSEGIAIRDYAKEHADVTFVNGSSGALETTYVTPADNFFRFNMDGAQWAMGLGDYIYNDKGWRKIATVGEDYSFAYTNLYGLVLEFCALGGEITERFWVPLGTKDFASIIAALPDDVDAIYLGLGGGDAVNFLNQYQQAGGDAALIGGTIMVDQTVLSSKGRAKEALVGTPASGPQADTWDDPKWQEYVKAYQDKWPPEKRFGAPSLLATAYYNATNAVLNGLKAVNGDLSDDQKAFREALSSMELDAPNGKITLDENRQAIGTNFVIEVVEGDGGELVSKLVKVVPDIPQTLGYDKATFDSIGLPGRETPECKDYGKS